MDSERRQGVHSEAFGVLADRVDGEPPAILGLTTTEVLMVSLTVGVVLLPLVVAVSLVLGLGDFALAATGFFFMGGVYAGSVIFRRLKRGRPQGHYQVMFAVLMQRLFGGNKFMLRSGPWSLGRTVRAADARSRRRK
jgi:conjugative transfer region protein (TIGR03750 family)